MFQNVLLLWCCLSTFSKRYANIYILPEENFFVAKRDCNTSFREPLGWDAYHGMHYFCILEHLVWVFFFITGCIFPNATKTHFKMRFLFIYFAFEFYLITHQSLPYTVLPVSFLTRLIALYYCILNWRKVYQKAHLCLFLDSFCAFPFFSSLPFSLSFFPPEWTKIRGTVCFLSYTFHQV